MSLYSALLLSLKCSISIAQGVIVWAENQADTPGLGDIDSPSGRLLRGDSITLTGCQVEILTLLSRSKVKVKCN